MAVLSGIFQLLLSLALGVVVAFTGYVVVARMSGEYDAVGAIKNGNVAVAISWGSMLLGAGLVIRSAIAPSVSTFRTVLFDGLALADLPGLLGLWVAYVLIAMTVAFGGMGLANRVFLILTKDLDEMGEIRANNIAVAVLFGSVVLVMALFLALGVEGFLSAIVPYPALGSIEIHGLD